MREFYIISPGSNYPEVIAHIIFGTTGIIVTTHHWWWSMDII